MAKSISLPRELLARFRGELPSRVEAFRAAREAHRSTIDVPAPLEDPLVVAIADAGGMDAVDLKIIEPPAAPQEHPSLLQPHVFRFSFTFEERCEIELCSHIALSEGNAQMKVLWEDLNCQLLVDLDQQQVADFLDLLIAHDVIEEGRRSQIERKEDRV
jgi:hypothetical protein